LIPRWHMAGKGTIGVKFRNGLLERRQGRLPPGGRLRGRARGRRPDWVLRRARVRLWGGGCQRYHRGLSGGRGRRCRHGDRRRLRRRCGWRGRHGQRWCWRSRNGCGHGLPGWHQDKELVTRRARDSLAAAFRRVFNPLAAIGAFAIQKFCHPISFTV
jgi:hypothetical protein